MCHCDGKAWKKWKKWIYEGKGKKSLMRPNKSLLLGPIVPNHSSPSSWLTGYYTLFQKLGFFFRNDVIFHIPRYMLYREKEKSIMEIGWVMRT